MLSYIMLCWAVLCYTMLCYAMLCHGMLYYIILYYIILYYNTRRCTYSSHFVRYGRIIAVHSENGTDMQRARVLCSCSPEFISVKVGDAVTTVIWSVKMSSSSATSVSLHNLMFFWPCIMNWLYINYQLDALAIIYS